MALPLDGIRVVDLTMMWAGPYATKLLADMGAEVVKIESPHHFDFVRTFVVPPEVGEWEKPYNRAAYFNEYNRNKLGLALDLATDPGRDVFRRLVAVSDVVIENFRAEVMDNLGFGYEALRAVKPDLIYVSMPGYGKTGPDAGLVGYGPSIEEMAGLASLSGDPDGKPLKSGISYGDPMAGIMAAGAVGAALLHRMATGDGQYIEVPQRDVLVTVMGDALMEWGMNERELPRVGNRDERLAPQGCYPSAPVPDAEARVAIDQTRITERWVTLTVEDDAQWAALCEVLGRPDLAADERFATAAGRQAHHDEIDGHIASWTAGLGDREAADLLLARGIPASPVLTMVDVGNDAHLSATGFIQTIEHPDGGPLRVTRPAWRLADGAAALRMPAPSFGRDNDRVLRDIVGLSDDEVAALVEAQVVSAEPLP